MTLPTVPSRPSVAIRVLNSVAVLVTGVAFVGVGVAVMILTVKNAAHDDKQLVVGAVMAILGALVISPAAMGGALRSLGLAVNQVWPGGKRASDPEK